MISTLYALDHAGTEATLIDLSNGIEAVAYVVGTLPDGRLVLHGQPGDEVPTTATVYCDGSSEWTWNSVVADYPELAGVVIPHEYAGEPTAANLDGAAFSRYSQSLRFR